MNIKLGEIVHFDVTLHSPSVSGQSKNADEVPKFWVFEEENDTGIIAASGMRNRTGFPGLYTGYFAASSANGFEATKFYNVVASGKVESIFSLEKAATFYVENNSFDDIASTSGIIRQNLDKTGYVLDPSQSGSFIYYADIRFHKDSSNSRDEYSCQWYRSDGPIPSSQISIPVLQVIDVTNGANLIASGSMSHVNINVGTVKFYESSSRTTAGENYIAKCSATLDGSVRNWQKLIGRDS